MDEFLKHPGVEIGAVSDVYQPRLEKGIQAAGGKAKAYKDFRQVLDDKDIDVVFVTSADDWHTLKWSWPAKREKTYTWKSPSPRPWKRPK